MVKVGIIVKTKNRNLFLQRALDDIAKQTYTDYLVVVVNDGGDKSGVEDVISKSKITGKVSLVNNHSSLGMSRTSNIGIKNSKTEYIVLHDDDDTWDASFLDKTVCFLESEFSKNHNVLGVASHICKISEKVVSDEIFRVGIEDFNMDQQEISLFKMLGQNQYAPISFLFSRQAGESVGFFNEDAEEMEDWEFNIKFLKKFNIGLIREPLANYHVRVESTDQIHLNAITINRNRMKILNSISKNTKLRQELTHHEGLIMSLSQRLTEIERKIDKMLAFVEQSKLS